MSRPQPATTRTDPPHSFGTDTCAMEGCSNAPEHECDTCHAWFCAACSTSTSHGGRQCYTHYVDEASTVDEGDDR